MNKTVKKIISVLSAGTIILSLAGCTSPSAAETTVNKNPQIASTSVAICEILDELEYDNVIGIPETSSDSMPKRYAGATTIGGAMSPDYEIIKSLSPDLVLSPKSLEDSLSADYSAAGINSAFLDMSSVEGMYSAINSLGELLDREKQAQKLIDEYNSYMNSYTAEQGSEKSVLILMAFPDGFYLVSTENSYVGNLVKLAGGKNVYGADANGDNNGVLQVNPEDMIQKNPDIILVYAHYSEENAFSYMQNEFKTNEVWQYYDAVKNDKIYYLPSESFGMSATLGWTDALEYLKPILHGE
ncbi:MAG: ABC transporter substrate-binding protein [Clostridium sp.]|nr:ABC transporter substrate-binding protein [Clostridium sp.]